MLKQSLLPKVFLLIILLLLAALGHLFIGHQSMNWWQGLSAEQWFVLSEFRFPRLLAAAIVGAGLAVAGVALQSLFRNPLAEPGLVGVSASAAFGSVLIMVLGGLLWDKVALWQVSLFGFAFGLGATLFIYRLATKSGKTDIALLLLAGVAINAIMAAGTQLLLSIADLIELRSVTFWLMGSIANVAWSSVILLVSLVMLSSIWLTRLVRTMNAFVLGEQSALYMGHDSKAFKWQVMILSALMVTATVAVVGVIGFVGLVVPHIIRLWVGADHRLVLPLSALGGALLLILADWFARELLYPLELPIGLLMALLGAPFFLIMLLKQRQGWA